MTSEFPYQTFLKRCNESEFSKYFRNSISDYSLDEGNDLFADFLYVFELAIEKHNEWLPSMMKIINTFHDLKPFKMFVWTDLMWAAFAEDSKDNPFTQYKLGNSLKAEATRFSLYWSKFDH